MAGSDQPPQGQSAQTEQERLQERAASYFVRQLDDASPDLIAEIDAWLSEDPRHAVAYARMAHGWDKAAVLRSAPPAPDHDPRKASATGVGGRGGDQQ